MNPLLEWQVPCQSRGQTLTTNFCVFNGELNLQQEKPRQHQSFLAGLSQGGGFQPVGEVRPNCGQVSEMNKLWELDRERSLLFWLSY
jgi:hypothetical protein